MLCDTSGLICERYWEGVSMQFQEKQSILKVSETPVNQSNQHRSGATFPDLCGRKFCLE